MGCTESKLDKDDTVRRCKERRRLMKEAVYAHHHLASAHSDYCRSLRFTGSALVTFASGESPIRVSDHIPPPSPSVHRPPMSTTSSHHRNPPIQLPHILSDSSFSSSPNRNFTHNARPNSTYSSSPSIWNWDNFYPPSPPDSDYFDRASNATASYSNNRTQRHVPSNQSSHSHYSKNQIEREEAECSQWEDHGILSSSSSDEGNEESKEDFDPAKNQAPAADSNVGSGNSNSNSKFWGEYGKGDAKPSDGRIIVRHKDLSEIFEGVRESFDAAASAGEPVSEMLEAGQAQLDRSFKHLKKTIYHSSGMLSNLSSSWTSKPPLAVKYMFEPSSFEQSNGPRSLCITLERLLAWEKKLYQEVKAREGVKIEHEKKLSLLQSQEYRGEDEAKLGKTKASIKRLQSLMLVTSQAVSATSSAIASLRDSHLIPQLVELCHGFMYAWRSMNRSHETQNQIVQQVHCLVTGTTKGKPTSDLHHHATCDLDSALSTWHSSFCRLIKSQRVLVRFLHAWFKLTLLPISNNQPTNKELTAVLKFFDEWKLASEGVPDTAVSGSIRSLNNVVHSISVKQIEELKTERRAEIARKELEKKIASLRNIEKKYYQSYSMVGIGSPDDNGHILDARDPLAEKKAELAVCKRRVEDEMVKHLKAVEVTRAMTLNNIQMGLPGVFHAMTSFSSLVTEALETVCTFSYAI